MTITADSALSDLRACVRPVVFATGLRTAPYSTAGTCFVVGYGDHVYVVTAKHVVRGMPIERLRIFPTDGESPPFEIVRGFEPDAGRPGEEAEDFVLFRVSSEKLAIEIRRKAKLFRVTERACEWTPLRDVSAFFVVGYPNSHSWVNYRDREIRTGQALVSGRYLGVSDLPHCHVAAVENPLEMPSFSGFSGSPVFSVRQRLGMSPSLWLCGVALSGSSEAMRMNFLDSGVLLRALGVANAA